MNEKRFYPTEVNLGKDCLYWQLYDGEHLGCASVKAELEGRTSCEGVVDDVCLFVKDGRPPKSLTSGQQMRIKTSPPNPANLPPGYVY